MSTTTPSGAPDPGAPDDPAAEVSETADDPAARRRPLAFVLHGARGDLSRRLVLPSLATLHRRGLLPERWALVGTGRTKVSTEEFRALVADSLEEFGHEGTRPSDEEALTRYARFASEVTEEDPGDLPSLLEELAGELVEGTDVDPSELTVVHYLATPPAAFGSLTRALGAHGLNAGPAADGGEPRRDSVRIVYEKPFGTSPESFRELDALVHEVFDEQQVFRIDHYLGKEGVQNLYVIRFGNELFRSVWDRHHVERVEIDVPETLDVAQRAEFYDATGAALDMVVSHLFQVAAVVAMEPPERLAAENLAAAREDALRSFRALDPEHDVVLGQFEGYRDIDGVDDDSVTDTFIAARLWIDNERWRDVPFVLRTGKRMGLSAQRVTLVLRRDPHQLFGDEVKPAAVSVSLAGDGALEITTSVKEPGPQLVLASGTARLELDDVQTGEPLPAYASLLDDVLVGDHTLFTTPDGLASAWRAFEPLLGDRRPEPLPYAPGTMGPAEADELVGHDGWWVQAP